MSFRKYCRGMSQRELLDYSIFPKANGLKNFSVLKKPTEVNTVNCSLVQKPFIEYSRLLTATASYHD